MSKIRDGEDKTLCRNNIKYMLYLIDEYQLIKAKKHTKFKFAAEFYNCHNLKRQNFIKYYHRFKQSNHSSSLLPQSRAPKYKTRRTPGFIEQKIINLRLTGANRYEIFSILKENLKQFTPSASTIYNIFVRNKMNVLKPKNKTIRRTIIKHKAGELGHIDCHYLPQGMLLNDSKRYYIIAIIDSCSRIAWAEVIHDITALTVMFNTLKMLNLLNVKYSIQFKDIITDNGSEFGSGKDKDNKLSHPFERLLHEMGIKHRYTRPYRPQTNGKVERFWKTLQFDFLDEMVFDDLNHFKDELQQYLLYYYELRPHQALNASTPLLFLQNLSPN